jgi:hypothetical protein
MNLASAFSEINWLSVLVSALTAFFLGFIWYSVLFKNSWPRLAKLTDEDIKGANMPLIFGTTFVLNVIGAFVLDMFIGAEATFATGFAAGLLVGVAWVATSIGINYLFARKSLRLYLIDAGYFVVFFTLMGMILGAW